MTLSRFRCTGFDKQCERSGVERRSAGRSTVEAAEQKLAKIWREIDRGHVSATDELNIKQSEKWFWLALCQTWE
jgi:hypothetical protein